MNDKWYKYIMLQRYQCDNFYDPTKLFIILSFTESNVLKEKYTIKEIAKYVYRYYISNIEIAKHNFNIIVRNINKYGIEDLIPVVISSINQWIREQKNNSITLFDNYIKLNLESYDSETLKLTRTIAKTLFQKYYKTQLKELTDYSNVLLLNDYDINTFGKSELKQLIFEDIQYCPLSEETNVDNLYVVHLFSKEDGANDLEFLNKDNLMLLSENVAKDYINKKFYFDEFGRVVNISSENVSNKMRLSINLMTNERKNFIIRHNTLIEKE